MKYPKIRNYLQGLSKEQLKDVSQNCTYVPRDVCRRLINEAWYFIEELNGDHNIVSYLSANGIYYRVNDPDKSIVPLEVNTRSQFKNFLVILAVRKMAEKLFLYE